MLGITRSALTAVALTILSQTMLLPVTAPATAGSLIWDDEDDDDSDEPCMTDFRMRQFLAEAGYSNIKLNSPIGTNWQAKGTQDGVAYLVVVDTCSAWIRQRMPLGIG